MRHILNLDRYPLDMPGTPEWQQLVEKCRDYLRREGMYNLSGFLVPDAMTQAGSELLPVIDTLSFTHRRRHNIYFCKDIPGLPQDHPALAMCETVNHTVCADQITQSIPLWIYEWAPFAMFLAATMGKDARFQARDPLARVNVMSYREGEQRDRLRNGCHNGVQNAARAAPVSRDRRDTGPWGVGVGLT